MKIIIILLGILASNIAYSEGKIKIKSDTSGAYIYIDGKKRSMTGDGYTTIKLTEGEHKIKISKKINEDSYLEGTRSIYVGENTEIELNIPLKKKEFNSDQNKLINKYICLLEKAHGLKMNITKNKITYHLYNPTHQISKVMASEYTFDDKKIYTSLDGNKFSYILKNNVLISDAKGFPVTCTKELSIAQQKTLSEDSAIIGSWTEGSSGIMSFKKDGSVLIDSYNKKNEYKWLIGNSNILMLTTTLNPNDYINIIPFAIKNNGNQLSFSNGNRIFKRVSN